MEVPAISAQLRILALEAWPGRGRLAAAGALLAGGSAVALPWLGGRLAGAILKRSGPTLKDRTVVPITHRPAALSMADRIFEVREGRLRELTRRPAAGEA